MALLSWAVAVGSRGGGSRDLGGGKREPDRCRREPGGGRREQGSGRKEPGGGRREPGDGRQEPGSGRWEPGGGRQELGSGKWEPGGCIWIRKASGDSRQPGGSFRRCQMVTSTGEFG